MNQQIEKMTKLPQQPWESVQLDFCGPFPSGEYAIGIDRPVSHYPEVTQIKRVYINYIELIEKLSTD